MKHDEQLLALFAEKIAGAMGRCGINRDSAEKFTQTICIACKEYSEIINAELIKQIDDMRWRSMDEKPEEGQTIECLVYDNHAIELWEYVEHVNTERIRAMNFQGWRPFRGMSEVQEVVE